MLTYHPAEVSLLDRGLATRSDQDKIPKKKIAKLATFKSPILCIQIFKMTLPETNLS